jgi:hypothetical protein
MAGLASPKNLQRWLIDVIAPVVPGRRGVRATVAAMPSTRQLGEKQAFGVEGLDAITGEWRFPAAGQRFTALQCAVQQ